MNKLTHARLKELLRYEPETGDFVWLISTDRRIRFGASAGSINHNGYRIIKIDYRRYRANRLAWFYQTGAWPFADVDHRDLNRSNNVWTNLREATRSQNRANIGVQRNNKLGVKGVSRRGDRYQVQITAGGVKRHIGTFNTQEEASAAYVAAAIEAFGKFARSA